MAGDANSEPSGQPDANICVTCKQPIIAAEDDNNPAESTSLQKSKGDGKPPVASSLTKKLRSSGPVSNNRKWDSRPNFPVFVHVYDGYGGRGWEPGIVKRVDDKGDVFLITTHVQNEAGDWVIPRTINENNQDPIPSKIPNDRDYKLSNYVRGREEKLDGLPDDVVKRWKCLNYHSGSSIDEKAFPDQGVVGAALLGTDPESALSIRSLIRSMMVNDKVRDIVKLATGKDQCTAEHALAYFVGQICGIELSDAGTEEADPKCLLDQIDGSVDVECPISQVFLTSAMISRTDKRKGTDPTAPLYDKRAMTILTDETKLKARMSKLKTALATIHASQTERPPLSGPAFALLSHGINMMIDMRGTSDPLLKKLAREGVCRPPRVLRSWIQKISEAINPLGARSPPPPGKSHVLGWTADNADYHLFHRCVSVVPVGNILLGIESEEETAHFNVNYMSGLGNIKDIEPEDIMANAADDKIAAQTILYQNVLAILTAAVNFDMAWLSGGSKTQSRRRNRSDSPRLDAGSKVAFMYRSIEREGEIRSISGKTAKIEFLDAGRLSCKPVPVDDIIAEVQSETPGRDQDRDQDPSGRDEAGGIAAEKEDKGGDFASFGGERHRFNPTTTSIANVLTGLSSKNNETARQVIDEIISQHGKKEFYKAVHVVVADQEFMPTIINEFFSKLGRGKEEELPIIPALAIGHAMKGISVSMMSFYQCFFDPIMESIGMKVGSPEYIRYCNGGVIRDTNRLTANTVEMLAVAVARKYLSEVGNDDRIAMNDTTNVCSPNSIINTYINDLDSEENPDPSACLVTVMDAQMRPLQIQLTNGLLKVAQDFELYMKARWGTTKRHEVGPSGYIRTCSSAETQEEDPQQAKLSEEIENDPEYMPYRVMPYSDDGDTNGLLSACVNADILGKSSRKDRETLSKKLFLFENRKDKEAALKFGPARKIPSGTNSTGLALYDLVFGVERYVVVAGHLLTRIRPAEETTEEAVVGKKRKRREKESNQNQSRDWLVFFKALTASTFMRWQPNYQRLTLSFLIQLTMILKHKDDLCIDIALKRIRWTMSVSEWGDSHKCEPMDLLQEHAMVEQVKKVGQRDPSATRQLRSRAMLHGFIRLREIESRANSDVKFGSILPSRAAQIQEEERRSHAIAAVWVGIVDAVDSPATDMEVDSNNGGDASSVESDDRIRGLGNEETQVLFADRSALFFRSLDAMDHILVSAAAFLKGYTFGCEVAIPPRSYTILRCLHRKRSKKSTTTQSQLSREAKRAQIEAEQSLREDEHMTIRASSDLLDGLAKAGEGKADVVPAVLSTMSHNRPPMLKDDEIGDAPGKPVLLLRTNNDASRLVMKRAEREGGMVAPVHRYVDIAKDLHGFIPRRRGGYDDTFDELARDIICSSLEKYYRAGVELLCLTMDVDEVMTSLRAIPHAKRGRMDKIEAEFGSLSNVRKGTDLLTPHGTRSDLLTSGNQRFIRLLFNTMCNQAKAAEAGQWTPSRDISKFALVIVGGSSQACVSVGKPIVRLISKSIMVTCQAIEDAMEERNVVGREEGEMMVYGAMMSIFELGFTHENNIEEIDSISEIYSDDSDAFGGISMQAIYNLESTFTMQRKSFTGAIYLHGPKKSVSQVSRLGNIFKTNLDIDRDLCPTGRGFVFMIDLVAAYYTLEHDDSLPELPKGHRAMSVVAVTYTLLNNDYLRMATNGLTYAKLIAVMKTKAYHKDVRKYGAEESSPINMTPRSTFTRQNHGKDKGYNLPGILMLLHHAFINRPGTKKVLLKRYSKDDLGIGIPYNVVRAASVYAGELRPVPDPIALLSHLSCANLIFRRWSCLLYDDRGRTDDELGATCYVKGTIKGRTIISVDHSLIEMGIRYRDSLDDSSLTRELRTCHYGALFYDSQFDTSVPMPFQPLEEARLALKCEGMYPAVKVKGDLLPPPPPPKPEDAAQSEGHQQEDLAVALEEMQEEALNYETGVVGNEGVNEENKDEDDQSVAGAMSEVENEEEEDAEDDQ